MYKMGQPFLHPFIFRSYGVMELSQMYRWGSHFFTLSSLGVKGGMELRSYAKCIDGAAIFSPFHSFTFNGAAIFSPFHPFTLSPLKAQPFFHPFTLSPLTAQPFFHLFTFSPFHLSYPFTLSPFHPFTFIRRPSHPKSLYRVSSL